MDVSEEDQALHAVFGKELGMDNEGLDITQLEEYLTNGTDINYAGHTIWGGPEPELWRGETGAYPHSQPPAHLNNSATAKLTDNRPRCFPEESIPAVAFNNGRNSYSGMVGEGGSPGKSPSSSMVAPPHQLPPQHMASPSSSTSSSSSSSQHSNQHPLPPAGNAHPHHHQQQQQQQHHHPRQPPHQQQQQQQIPYNTHDVINYKNIPFNHPSLPESPPDSGSEPYSPPQTSQDIKTSIGANMTTLPQQLYAGPHHHHHGVPGTEAPPMPHIHAPPQHLKHYNGYEPPKLNHLPPPPTSQPPGPPPGILPPHFNSMNNTANHPNKKRKYTDSPNGTLNNALLQANLNSMMNIKQEPGVLLDCSEDEYGYDMGSEMGSSFLDGSYQVIKWQAFQPTKWSVMLDGNCKDLPAPSYRVDADKGFNFSCPDDSFVCQKKNHFQVTVHIGLAGEPTYIRAPEGPKKIDAYFIHFQGVKMESPGQTIKVEQSQSDRSKKAFHPVRVDMSPDQVIKITIGRLHFSETTSNNMRKKGKPNPDQRYFLLVVALHAHCGDTNYMIASHVSEKIIVRASNPGQFDSDVDVLWSKGHTPDSVYHGGRVGVNTDKPDEALTVHGNMKLTGHIIQPSDKRAKENFKELDPKEQLRNVSKMRIYQYNYKEDFAEQAGIPEEDIADTGVIAQEVQEVLPDAVRETGDVVLSGGSRIENFMVVNKDRIYMENVGAVKELCKLTDNLENRIDELEKMNKKLSKLKRIDSLKSTSSNKSFTSNSTMSRSNSTPASVQQKRRKPTSELQHGQPVDAADQGLCSNKVIQITVVVLVLVMAFCLVSITTLYILERHKHGYIPSIGKPVVTSPALPNRTNTTQDRLPSWSTPLPTRFTPSKSTGSLPSVPTGGAGQGPVGEHSCTGVHCKVFCCPPPGPDEPPSYHTVKPHVDPISNRLKNKSVRTHAPQGMGGHLHVVVGHQTVKPKYPDDVPLDNPNDALPADPGPSVVDPKVVNLENDVVRYRERRSGVVPPDSNRLREPNGFDTMSAHNLYIKDFNTSIGADLCTGEHVEDCRRGLGGNYSYAITMSKYFPPIYATIEFGIPSDMKVFLCSHHYKQACHEATSGGQPTEVGHSVDLPIGFFFHNSYKIRVVQVPPSSANLPVKEHVCKAPDSELNSKFVEYHLLFQKVCDK